MLFFNADMFGGTARGKSFGEAMDLYNEYIGSIRPYLPLGAQNVISL